jgi:hypothetical protein
VTSFQTICLLVLSRDYDIHSGDDIATCIESSLRLFLGQTPY